jgi:hypothetical protein
MIVKLRLTAAIVIVALLAPGAAARPLRAQQEEAERLTPEEEREARDLAASLVRRFAAAKDYAPLLEEFFVRDLAERLGGEASAAEVPTEDSFPFLRFVEPETVRQVDATDLRRFYAATLNCYFLAELRGRVAKYAKNKDRREEEDEKEAELRDYFPPDALTAAQRNPLLAKMIEEADDSDKPAEPEDESKAGEGDEADGKLMLKGVVNFREMTATLEEVAALLRSSLKSLPADPLAGLLGEDLSASELAGEAVMDVKVEELNEPFRGEPEGARLVCVTARMFHIDLVQVERRFRVLNVSSESYELQTDEQRRSAERLAELLRAIQSGDTEMFEELLREGVNVNAKEADGGMTPLHYAALHKRPNMLRALIDRGADVNAKNRHGNTVLLYATNSPEVTLALLSAGADVNAENGNGLTALKIASRYSSKEAREVVRILKNFGARE